MQAKKNGYEIRQMELMSVYREVLLTTVAREIVKYEVLCYKPEGRWFDSQ
jgi:hypothetical protein